MMGKKPLLQGPKRHHFLPRFYLEGFCVDGQLALYDRQQNAVRVQTPTNTGLIGHFYTIEDKEGRKRFELEALLSEYEGLAAPGLRSLIAGKQVTPEQRAYISIFIALAGFRTPDVVDSIKLSSADMTETMIRRTFRDVESVKEILRPKHRDFTEEELEQESKELIDFVQGYEYRVTTSHQWAVGTAITLALKIAPTLSGRDWYVLHPNTTDLSFVTTDAPVHLTTVAARPPSIYGVGYGNRDALVVFPVSQNTALMMFGNRGKFEHHDVSETDLDRINAAVAGDYQRFVIGRDVVTVSSLVDKLDLASQKWQPKMQRS